MKTSLETLVNHFVHAKIIMAKYLGLMIRIPRLTNYIMGKVTSLNFRTKSCTYRKVVLITS